MLNSSFIKQLYTFTFSVLVFGLVFPKTSLSQSIPGSSIPDVGSDIATISLNEPGNQTKAFVTFGPGNLTEAWSRSIGNGIESNFLASNFSSNDSADIAAICTNPNKSTYAFTTSSPGNHEGTLWQSELTKNKLTFYYLPGDFNGDGFSDIAAFYTGKNGDNTDDVRVKFTFGPAGESQSSDSTDWLLAGKRKAAFVAGDFHGINKITDIAAITRDSSGNLTAEIYRGPDGVLSSQNKLIIGPILQAVAFRSGDFDGDGFDDLATLYKSLVGDYRARIVSERSGEIIPNDWSLGSEHFNKFLVNDFDKDGVADIAAIYQEGTSNKAKIIHNPDLAKTTELWALANGNIFVSGNFNSDSVINLLPATPQNVQASDSLSENFIRITWDIVNKAEKYNIYRSRFVGELGSLLTTTTLTSYDDSTAVPGVSYYYSVSAENSFGESPKSTQDVGIRSLGDGSAPDRDGDGVSDEQEFIDGTNPDDPGSFQLHLKSPAFTKYNTFLGQHNFLELSASGTKTIKATISIFDIQGKVARKSTVVINPQEEVDVDIHSLVSKPDTYGVVKIDFNNEPGATLTGRMTNYRPDKTGGTFSFAFAKELRNAIRGVSYATGNSYDPQGQSYLVPNWAEIINIDPVKRGFTHKLYDQSGKLLLTKHIVLPSLGEFDIQAGHEFGQGVFVSEFIPDDGATNYLAYVSRYSSNSPAGTVAETYNFAFALDAKVGTGDRQFASITNEVGTCWSQTNWVEVVNVREKPVNATVQFRDNNGLSHGKTVVKLQPMSQFHFNASSLLDKNSTGSVEIASSDTGALISQSLVYFHDCKENSLQSAYASPARILGRDVQQGTFNTFLGMKNLMKIVNGSASSSNFTLEVKNNTGVLSTQVHQLNTTQALDFNVSDSNIFSTKPDMVGTITIRTTQPNKIIGENIRLREINGKVDFAIPTVIQ